MRLSHKNSLTTNIELPSYKIEPTPTESSAGRTLIYIAIIKVPIGLFQEKTKEGGGAGLRTYFFEHPLEFLGFLLYPWKFQKKQRFTLRKSTKLCYTPRKFQGLKLRPLEIPHDFFLIDPGNSALFLINPCNFHSLFLQYP